MVSYWLDATEVSNGQYAKFLEEWRTAYAADGKLGTLHDVACDHFLKLSPKEKEGDDVAWRQLLETNKEALIAALPAVEFPQGFKTAVLPRRDLTLVFTTKRPPDDWPAMWPNPERLGHPVRFVSCLDALAFCEWAGKHLMDEFEYEYAARGPEGWAYPWGMKWKSDLSRCNWGAKNVDAKTHEADTWIVGSCPAGRSQFDVYDLLGNVAEWTDSWFLPYPKGNQNHDFMRAVKIIRGGTAVDQELLVLRPAYRNFVGEGFKAPPYPQNRYRWVGFRCAWWPQPGANQAPAILARIYKDGRLKLAQEADEGLGRPARPDQLDKSRMAGSVAENFIPTDVSPENGIGVLGRCRAVVAVPRSYVLDTEDPAGDAPSVVRAKSKAGLLGESETASPVIVLGAFHTDVRLPKVWVRLVLPPPANEQERKEREKEKEKKRGRSEAPAVIEGVCQPGTYILGLWHKRLCLLDGSREFKCFLTAADKAPNLDVKKLKSDETPTPCKVQVDADLGTISVTLAMPLMIGKNADETLWLTASFSAAADTKDLESANGWR
jgi:formylglycine-generating enzyme required for sulfatase activity